MVNKKIVAQVKFILCFHSAFWQKHFQWFLTAPKWMDNMPSNNRIGGCHAPEMVRRLIMIMRKLTSLKGSFDSHTRFANWQAAVAPLPSPEDRKPLVLQAEVAREQFCLVIERMCGAGWLEEKVDASIFDEEEEVAFHTAAKLLSVYHHGDGRFEYAAPGPDVMVTIDGVGVPLAALVDEMTQFIDGEEGAAQLRKQSLFFMDPNKVSPD